MRLDPANRPDPSNRYADDPAAAKLGNELFFDARLSGDGTLSCASCHLPELHFTDGKVLGAGKGETARHVPGIAGNTSGPWFFWDGRADSLWAQAQGPLENPIEMASDRMTVVRAVTTDHADAYTALFGAPPDLSDGQRFPIRACPGDDPAMKAAWEGMTPEDRDTVDRAFANILKSLAAYERTLIPKEAPFDRYVDHVLAGDATGGGELTDAQIRGLSTFVRDGCTNCHHGPMLTDRTFHNLGVAEPRGYDPGRQAGASAVLVSEFRCTSPYSDTTDCPELKFIDPQFPDFQAAFKTPSLRSVGRTAPYMHNGAFPTLESVVAFYSTLPGDPPAGHRELTLKPLNFTPEESADLVDFLGTLDGG